MKAFVAAYIENADARKRPRTTITIGAASIAAERATRAASAGRTRKFDGRMMVIFVATLHLLLESWCRVFRLPRKTEEEKAQTAASRKVTLEAQKVRRKT